MTAALRERLAVLLAQVGHAEGCVPCSPTVATMGGDVEIENARCCCDREQRIAAGMAAMLEAASTIGEWVQMTRIEWGLAAFSRAAGIP